MPLSHTVMSPPDIFDIVGAYRTGIEGIAS
jgi:hypothetical protein